MRVTTHAANHFRLVGRVGRRRCRGVSAANHAVIAGIELAAENEQPSAEVDPSKKHHHCSYRTIDTIVHRDLGEIPIERVGGAQPGESKKYSTGYNHSGGRHGNLEPASRLGKLQWQKSKSKCCFCTQSWHPEFPLLLRARVAEATQQWGLRSSTGRQTAPGGTPAG